MDKLTLLYDVMDKARKMTDVKTEVQVKINYDNIVFDKKFLIKIEGDKTRYKKSKKSIKIKKSKAAYAMMFIDMVSRININESSSKKIISLKINSFDDLPEESNELIYDYMQNNSKGVKDKLFYVTDMLGNGSSAAEILDTVKQLKKLDISLKEVEPRAVNLELEVDGNLNLNSLKFYAEGINVDEGKTVSINFKEKLI